MPGDDCQAFSMEYAKHCLCVLFRVSKVQRSFDFLIEENKKENTNNKE